MGNCLFGGDGDDDHDDYHRRGGVSTMIKVITSNGGIMEFYSPITASCITQEFPGHAIFPIHHLFWKPLSLHEELQPGKSYYLLAINSKEVCVGAGGGQVVREGHIRSNSIPATPLVSSYRMSFDYQGMLKRSYTEVFSRYNNSNSNKKGSGGSGGGGIWKVKLVISPENLLEILSQEARTEELIDSVRTVAKCGTHGPSMSSSSTSAAFSDEWSLSSGSRNASSKKDYLLDI